MDKGEISRKILSDITIYSKYARYLPEKQRRETWEEIVLRTIQTHTNKYKHLESEIYDNFRYVIDKKTLPSMRFLQFGGLPIEINPSRGYNCSYAPIDHLDTFAEAMFLLLSGCGFSFSVQQHHIEKLPELRGTSKRNRKYLINDSIIGWADAIKQLIYAYFYGKSNPDFDYRDIRPKGTALITSGGKAPGPQPLKDCIHNIRKILDNALIERGPGTKLKPIEAHDICCWIADAVLSGGIRRAACLSGFSYDDEEMLSSKANSWFDSHPERQRSNNSVVLLRRKLNKESFDKIFTLIQASKFGEPGFILSHDKEYLFNPCFTGDTQIGVADGRNKVSIRELAEIGDDVPVYSVNPVDGKVSIKMGRNPRKTGVDREVVKIILDDGTHIKVTPEHKMLLRNGEPIEAKDLKFGDSLSRFTKRAVKMSENNNNLYYRINCNTKTSKMDKIMEHRLIARYHYPKVYGDLYDSVKKNGWLNGGVVIHHKDYNGLNNSPDNLEIMSFKDHCLLHSSTDTAGEKNGRYSGYTNDELKLQAIKLTRKLGRRFSVNEWKCAGFPSNFSDWRRKNFFNSPKELSIWASKECELFRDCDLRTEKLYLKAISEGYVCKIFNKTVYVKKSCEECGTIFFTTYNTREISFCSRSCVGNYRLKTDKHILKASQAKISMLKEKRDKQVDVYNTLKLSLGRDPLKKEWEQECSKQNVPHRIASRNQNAYKKNECAFFSYKDLKECASEYNHKVVKIEFLKEREDVYNITVDDNHTVAIVTGESGGIFTFQCGEASLQNNSFCNLTTIVATDITTQEEFNKRAKAAAFIGTIQAGYTDFHYLRDIWKKNTEKDALLGVSITGLANESFLKLDFKEAAEVVKKENERVAKLIGINKAARTTLAKPEGTTSCVVGSSSGVHSWHSKFYIRRVRLNKDEPIYKYLIKAIPNLIEDDVFKPHTQAVLSIPMKAPDDAITREESAKSLLERCVKLNSEWIQPGHRKGANTHNVSATINVRDGEWDEVKNIVWNNIDNINGMTFYAYDGGDYPQRPFEECTESTYNEMLKLAKNIDLTKIKEEEDLTDLAGESSCSGGQCTITHM